MQRAIEEREEYLSRLRAYCRQLREHILSKRERSILSTVRLSLSLSHPIVVHIVL